MNNLTKEKSMNKRLITTVFILLVMMLVDVFTTSDAKTNVAISKTNEHYISSTTTPVKFKKFKFEMIVPVYEDQLLYKNVKGTVYHAVSNQTDDSPLYTADNSYIDTTMVNDLKWVAVSRDLLNRRFTDPYGKVHVWKGKLKLGDTIWVDYDSIKLKKMSANSKSGFNKQLYDKLVAKHEKIKGFWIVRDIMGPYYYEMKNNGQYYRDAKGNRKKVYITNAIDFLQHPKTGVLDMWNNSIIITKRKIVGHKIISDQPMDALAMNNEKIYKNPSN
jgi:hypothetical protein